MDGFPITPSGSPAVAGPVAPRDHSHEPVGLAVLPVLPLPAVRYASSSLLLLLCQAAMGPGKARDRSKDSP